jgi:hypothetical protein
VESNGVENFQLLVHLVFLRALEVQPAKFFLLFVELLMTAKNTK